MTTHSLIQCIAIDTSYILSNTSQQYRFVDKPLHTLDKLLVEIFVKRWSGFFAKAI